MNNNPSPLRYPGGKASFYPRIREILKINNLLGSTYIEPFAGGAGLALRLLISDDVSRIVINDIVFHIYAFWYSVLHYTDELCRLILTTKIDVVNHSRLKEFIIMENKVIYSSLGLQHSFSIEQMFQEF